MVHSIKIKKDKATAYGAAMGVSLGSGKSGLWQIPSEAVKPVDGRYKVNKAESALCIISSAAVLP